MEFLEHDEHRIEALRVQRAETFVDEKHLGAASALHHIAKPQCQRQRNHKTFAAGECGHGTANAHFQIVHQNRQRIAAATQPVFARQAGETLVGIVKENPQCMYLCEVSEAFAVATADSIVEREPIVVILLTCGAVGYKAVVGRLGVFEMLHV